MPGRFEPPFGSLSAHTLSVARGHARVNPPIYYEIGPNMAHQVYILELITKNDLEDTQRLKAQVFRNMKSWCRAGFHAKRLLKFVVVTPETVDQIFDRLNPSLDMLKDLGSIERFAVYDAPLAVITDHNRQLDPFAHYLRLGHVEAAERNKSHRLRYRERR